MKRAESCFDIKSRSVWEFKAVVLEKPPDQEAYSLLQQITDGLITLKQEIKINESPRKKFKSVVQRIRRKTARRIDFNSISKNEVLKVKISDGIDRHFDELNSKILEVSQGKFNLNTVAPKKKIIESTETVPLHALDTGPVFSESIKIKLLQLKIKDEEYNLRHGRIIRRKKRIKLQLEKSHSSIINYTGILRPLATRSNCFASTLPAISRSILY